MVKPTKREESRLYSLGFSKIAGIDEAGRGSWAGPIVAAAVIMPRKFKVPGINDSKKISPKKREELFNKITSTALCFGISVISRKKIDQIGLGQANKLVLRQCVYKLELKPDYVLIDGFNIYFRKIKSRRFIKGDSRVVSIAAASILAKVYRDRIMKRYHAHYPEYNFHINKGYGTYKHRQAIKVHGICVQHRLSFKPMKSMK